MNADFDDGKVSNEFEEIHAGRRLVLEYSISPYKKIATVVLDSVATLEDELAVECAALLVPHGKEGDWMYSSEGGQWQLLASVGASRLILFSRTSSFAEDFKQATTRRFSAEQKGGRALNKLGSANEFIGTSKQAETEQREVCNDLNPLEQRGEPNGQAIDPWQDKSDLWSKTNPQEAKENTKLKRRHDDHLCQEKHLEGFDEKRELRSSRDRKRKKRLRTEEQQLPDEAVDSREEPLSLNCSDAEDESLKRMLGSLVFALAPKNSFKAGIPNIPFVCYTDNVVQRVVVEEALSALTGLIRVEDVELEVGIEDKEINEPIHSIQGMTSRGPPTEYEPFQPMPSCSSEVKKSTSSWRRRLIFKRMPNLIQTEVLLKLYPAGDSRKRASDYWTGLNKTKNRRNSDRVQPYPFKDQTAVRQVDHSRLVHKYLPPIVAGFVLVASCLDACLTSNVRRAQVLSIGVGGGALPIFLQKNFQFHIQVIDLDEGVLELARKHFGLREDAYFQVTAGDGLAAVEAIAASVIQEGVVDDGLKQSWTFCLNGGGPARPLSACHDYLPKAAKEEYFSSSQRKMAFGACFSEAGCQHDNESDLKIGASLDCLKLSSSDVLKEFSDSEKQKIPDPSRSWSEVSLSSSTPSFLKHRQHQTDSRLELIIVDVDVDDAQLGLGSPPVSFLERRFLLSARVALQEGGMLAMNVVPCGNKPYEGVITALKAVFSEVYEIVVDDDVNRIVFALPTPASSTHHMSNSNTIEQVKKVVGDRLVQRIQRLETLS